MNIEDRLELLEDFKDELHGTLEDYHHGVSEDVIRAFNLLIEAIDGDIEEL